MRDALARPEKNPAKIMKFSDLICTAVVVFVTASAHAETYNYTYTFDTSNVVTGSFDGTTDGNLVTNLSNVSAYLNGVAFPGSGSLFVGSWTNAPKLRK